MSDNLSSETTASAQIRPARTPYLDNLRASLTALVICHHCNSAYGSPGGWGYIVTEEGGVFGELFGTMFAGITQAFFMSSFFLISAYFTPAGFETKGSIGYAKRRFARLGIPLIAYYFGLSVLLSFLIRVYEGQTGPRLFQLDSYYFGRCNPGPLWFVEALFVFELAYWGVRQLGRVMHWKPRAYPLPTDRQILIFTIGIGVFTFFFRQCFSLNFHMDPKPFPWSLLTWPVRDFRLAFFPLYVCMFTFGVIAYRSGWFEQLTERQANRWFYGAIAAIALMPPILALNAAMGYDAYKFWGGFTWQNFVYSAWEPWVCVGINLKLIVWFRDRFSYSTPFIRRMTKSAFTAYIIHGFGVTFFTWVFTGFSLGRVPEIILMWPFAVATCFLAADVIRRAPGLRQIL